MKSMKLMLLVALLIAGLAACKKDDNVTPGITGTWEGTWGFGNDTPEYFERWEIKQNGDVFAYDDDGDLYAEGEWQLEGTIFTMHYQSVAYNDYSFAGEYNETTLEIIGTWGGTPRTTDGGTFEMAK